MEQSVMEKLTILADSAKYDVACTSSGSGRRSRAGGLGSCYAPGCCHAFTADGRCVSLLKVLMTNCCSFDCAYCVNRRSNDLPRATFTPRELADLTIAFYRRNYIEGLFLSSAVLGTADYTTERMIEVLRLLREEYGFHGYIHAKAIPGTSPALIQRLGCLADRLSVNIELPSESSLHLLAPDKGRREILRPMGQIAAAAAASREELTLYRHAPAFAPAGQSTQMIVGYQFRAEEILDQSSPYFSPYLDPKCGWAVRHLELFPVDVNRAPYEMLLRVPGIGVKSAQRIRTARRQGTLGLEELKRMGVVLKRAQYFITCRGFTGASGGRGIARRQQIARALIDPGVFNAGCEQLSLFSAPAVQQLAAQGTPPRLAGRLVQEEAVQCLANTL